MDLGPQTLKSLALAYHVSSLGPPIRIPGHIAGRVLLAIGHAASASVRRVIATEIPNTCACYLETREHSSLWWDLTGLAWVLEHGADNPIRCGLSCWAASLLHRCWVTPSCSIHLCQPSAEANFPTPGLQQAWDPPGTLEPSLRGPLDPRKTSRIALQHLEPRLEFMPLLQQP